MKKLVLHTFAVAALACLSGLVYAGPKCTDVPKDQWMSKEAMKTKAMEMGYSVRLLKETKGRCYEIYGYNSDGKKVEVYFHPVDGKIVKEKIKG